MKTAQILSMLMLPLGAISFPLDERATSIVGGASIPKGQFIQLVSLQDQGSNFCGGTLINKNTIVTAAHCSDRDLAELRVRAGSLVSPLSLLPKPSIPSLPLNILTAQ